MKILVTGCAGFIGFHTTIKLIKLGFNVIGIDNINNYYDKKLKKDRLNKILKSQKKYKGKFKFYKIDICDEKKIIILFKKFKFKKIIHLAAQAGVRYSLKNPYVYLRSNQLGFGNLLQQSKNFKVKHFIYASSSSVYGATNKIPYEEHISDSDRPIQIYAATKKSNELLAHAYSHLFNFYTTGLRFFTVYGPWGRPDMALFKFAKGIINKKKIDIYNQGKMYRDFTYIDDVVESISLLINKAPNMRQYGKIKNDSLSPVAPFRILNIGNTRKVYLLDFLNTLEKKIGAKAIRNYMPMQKGDVKITLSDTTLLKKLTGYNSKTSYKTGINKFIKWYTNYYHK